MIPLPPAFKVFCFLIRFSLKLGEIQEENVSPWGHLQTSFVCVFMLQVDDTATVSLLSKMLGLHKKGDTRRCSTW